MFKDEAYDNAVSMINTFVIVHNKSVIMQVHG